MTLTGSVDTEMAGTRAPNWRDDRRCQRVTNNLIVGETTASMPPSEPDPQRVALTDPAVTATLKGRLLADPIVSGLKSTSIHRTASSRSREPLAPKTEREQAVRLARDTAGVMGVEDKLIVKRALKVHGDAAAVCEHDTARR